MPIYLNLQVFSEDWRMACLALNSLISQNVDNGRGVVPRHWGSVNGPCVVAGRANMHCQSMWAEVALPGCQQNLRQCGWGRLEVCEVQPATSFFHFKLEVCCRGGGAEFSSFRGVIRKSGCHQKIRFEEHTSSCIHWIMCRWSGEVGPSEKIT